MSMLQFRTPFPFMEGEQQNDVVTPEETQEQVTDQPVVSDAQVTDTEAEVDGGTPAAPENEPSTEEELPAEAEQPTDPDKLNETNEEDAAEEQVPPPPAAAPEEAVSEDIDAAEQMIAAHYSAIGMGQNIGAMESFNNRLVSNIDSNLKLMHNNMVAVATELKNKFSPNMRFRGNNFFSLMRKNTTDNQLGIVAPLTQKRRMESIDKALTAASKLLSNLDQHVLVNDRAPITAEMYNVIHLLEQNGAIVDLKVPFNSRTVKRSRLSDRVPMYEMGYGAPVSHMLNGLQGTFGRQCATFDGLTNIAGINAAMESISSKVAELNSKVTPSLESAHYLNNVRARVKTMRAIQTAATKLWKMSSTYGLFMPMNVIANSVGYHRSFQQEIG